MNLPKWLTGSHHWRGLKDKHLRRESRKPYSFQSSPPAPQDTYTTTGVSCGLVQLFGTGTQIHRYRTKKFLFSTNLSNRALSILLRVLSLFCINIYFSLSFRMSLSPKVDVHCSLSFLSNFILLHMQLDQIELFTLSQCELYMSHCTLQQLWSLDLRVIHVEM